MAKAPKKPATTAAAKPEPEVPSEINGAGDGAGGAIPASATGAGGDAGQDPTTPAVANGAASAPEATTPAVLDAAGTNAPAESPAASQGDAGGVAAPHAAGGGADSPAAVAPAEQVDVILLSDVDHDGVRLQAGRTLSFPADVAIALVSCGAAELDD